MTTIADIHDGLATLLAEDVTFRQQIDALGLGADGAAAVPAVWRGFRDPRQIHASKLPLMVLETGDSEAQAATNDGSQFGVLGYTQQEMAADVLIGLVWHQPDHDKAYAQRVALESIFVLLLLRNPDVGGALQAWVHQVQYDRGALHPTQTAVVTVRVEYVLARPPPPASSGSVDS